MSEMEKSVYRLAPVPAYDVEGMESWLTDLASEGLFLETSGFFCGVGSFRRDVPQKVAYRLAAMEKKRRGREGSNGYPDSEAMEFSEAMGWEYVTYRDQFYIYRSKGAVRRELNTDPKVQALALREVQKKSISSLMLALFYVLIYPLFWMKGRVLTSILQVGTVPISIGFVLVTMILFVNSILRLHSLGSLRKRLKNGQHPDHRRDWRKGAYWRPVASVVLWAALAVWCIGLFGCAAKEEALHNKTSLSDYTGDPPFATMLDFAGGKGRYEETIVTSINGVSDWSDPLAPRIILWRECATVYLPQGGAVSGGLFVDYYETRSPWMAQRIAKEYVAYAKRNAGYQALPVPDLSVEVDYVAAYREIGHVLVLCKGNVMIQVRFSYGPEEDGTDGPVEWPLEEWASIAAETAFGE